MYFDELDDFNTSSFDKINDSTLVYSNISCNHVTESQPSHNHATGRGHCAVAATDPQPIHNRVTTESQPVYNRAATGSQPSQYVGQRRYSSDQSTLLKGPYSDDLGKTDPE